MAVDAEARLGRGKRLSRLPHGGAAVLHPLLVDEGREVIPDRRLELGLVVHEVEDRQIRGDAAGRDVESLAGHALGGGLAAQGGEAGAEIGLGRSRGREAEAGKNEESGGKNVLHAPHLAGN